MRINMGFVPTTTVLAVVVSWIVSSGHCSPSPVLDFLDPFLPQDDGYRQGQGLGLNKELSASGAAAGHVGADLGGVGFDADGALAGSKSLEFHKNKGLLLDKGHYVQPVYQRPLPPPPCDHGPAPRPLPPRPHQYQYQQKQYRPHPNQIPHQPHYRSTADMDGPDNSEDLVAVDFDKDGDVDADDAHAMAVMDKDKKGDQVKAKREVTLLLIPTLPGGQPLMDQSFNATASGSFNSTASNSTEEAKAKRNLDAQFTPLPNQAQHQNQYQNQPGRQTGYGNANVNAPLRHQAPERIVSPRFRGFSQSKNYARGGPNANRVHYEP